MYIFIANTSTPRYQSGFFFEIPHPLTLTVYLSLTNSLRKNPPPDPMRPRQGDCFSDQSRMYLNEGLT